MNIIMIFILAIISIMSVWKEKNRYNPAFIFSLYWLVIILFSTINIYGLKKVDVFVYEMVLVGSISFFIGCLFPVIKIHIINGPKQYLPNTLRISVLFWITAIFLAIIDSSAIVLLITGSSIQSIRYVLHENVFSSYLSNVVFKFVAYPLAIAYIVYFISSIVINKTFKRNELFKAVTITLMDYIANGDRIIIYVWAVGFVVAYYTIRTEFRDTVAYKIIKRVGFVIVLLAVVIMLGRRNESGSFFSGVITYFTGGLVYLSRSLERITQTAGNTVFVASYQGFFRPIMGALEQFGIKWQLFENASDFLMSNQLHSYSIDTLDNRYFNYFTTCFGYFYFDFKILGVIIHSFVFGYLSNRSYKKMRYCFCTRNLGIYLFWVICIALGMMNFAMAETSVALGLVYYTLFFSKE